MAYRGTEVEDGFLFDLPTGATFWVEKMESYNAKERQLQTNRHPIRRPQNDDTYIEILKATMSVVRGPWTN